MISLCVLRFLRLYLVYQNGKIYEIQVFVTVDCFANLRKTKGLCCYASLAVEQSSDDHVHTQDHIVCLQDTSVEVVGTKSLYVLGHAGFSIAF